MDHEEDVEFRRISRELKKLGPSAQKLFGLLVAGERSVEDLANLLDLQETTVLHFLRKLEDLGLVTSKHERQYAQKGK
jgi:predicted transcriptional regulator